jgi:hypothetical protein
MRQYIDGSTVSFAPDPVDDFVKQPRKALAFGFVVKQVGQFGDDTVMAIQALFKDAARLLTQPTGQTAWLLPARTPLAAVAFELFDCRNDRLSGLFIIIAHYNLRRF